MLYPREVEVEERPCPLGCKIGDKKILMGRDRLHNLPGEYAIVKCQTCGLARTNPRPTPSTIGFYYPREYGPYKTTQVTPGLRPSRPVPGWKKIMRKILDRNARKIPPIKPGRMLEIGCASGSFLKQMDTLGWNVEGLEFSEEAASKARSLGFPVHSGALETAPTPRKPYDLVVGWMVLEHLHDPIYALKKLNLWTKPGGWLVLSIPDAGSFEFIVFKDISYALQLPTHLYHYTLKTLKSVLHKGEWEFDRVIWENNPNNLLQSLRYVYADRGWNKGADYLLDIAEGRRHQYLHLLLGKLLGLLHASGRMTVWARRA